MSCGCAPTATTWRCSSARRNSERRPETLSRDCRRSWRRLSLLQQITRAIGERQDLPSICQVVIRTIEDRMPLDFACMTQYVAAENCLVVTGVGLKGGPLSREMELGEQARIQLGSDGLSRCVKGEVLYDPDLATRNFDFAQQLADVGLGAMVAVPLRLESQTFGVLIAARHESEAFSSGDCEFLRQLCEHVALAANQAETHEALQRAYDDLRLTQQAVMQQERLRALGQMASGIAHDINNAISPIALYVEALLEREAGMSDSGRGYLKVIQRAMDDVVQTVARMREFYRMNPPSLELTPVDLNELSRQVLDITRARWSDMPQQRGIVIRPELKLAENLPLVPGVESEIREALINLVFNAVDAMPKGGTLILRTLSDGADRVLLEVADSGVGVFFFVQILRGGEKNVTIEGFPAPCANKMARSSGSLTGPIQFFRYRFHLLGAELRHGLDRCGW